ncbi:CU044_5270 family protein [Nonomuraea sp. NPDC000554]|uniref:CU044_5270 family protein n=1 Tax=Nonomuraea sp. NPDC000554 TaxID=3154259 RepID=UPI00332BC0EF
MNDRMFAQLKPEALDELTEEAHSRRRSSDLARVFQTPQASRPSRRFTMPRSLLLIAGTAAAGLAAAAVIVTSGDSQPGTSPAAHTAVAAKPVSARSFLLAAAATAMREPATSGQYWYVRERTLQKVHNVPSEYMAAIKPLLTEQEKKEKELKDDPKQLTAYREEVKRKIDKLKEAELPYLAFATDTGESWRAMKKGEAGRVTRNQDTRISFGSPQDEAAWKAAGSPALVDEQPRTYDDGGERILSIDNPSLTIQNLSDLPTSKDALKSRLDALFKQSPNSARTDRAGYLWQTGVDLMTAPIKPGTRSALFQVLADQPGITSQGEVTDAMGRTGVALSTSGTNGPDFRMIVDAGTAELLQYEVVQGGQPQLQVALEKTGWTDRLGDRP